MITKRENWLTGPDWAKKITSKRQINLQSDGTYSLGGEWVDANESVSVCENEYLIVARHSGYGKKRLYTVAIVTVMNGELADINDADGSGEGPTMKNALDSALAESKITEKQRAAAMNSTPYSAALWLSLLLPEPQPSNETNETRRTQNVDPLTAEIEAGFVRINSEAGTSLTRDGILAKLERWLLAEGITFDELMNAIDGDD